MYLCTRCKRHRPDAMKPYFEDVIQLYLPRPRESPSESRVSTQTSVRLQCSAADPSAALRRRRSAYTPPPSLVRVYESSFQTSMGREAYKKRLAIATAVRTQ